MATTTTIGSYHPATDPTRRDLVYVYDSVREWARVMDGCPLLRGRLIEDVSVSATPSKLFHGLDRRPVGILPVMMDSAVMLSCSDVNERSMMITATGDAVISLWVF